MTVLEGARDLSDRTRRRLVWAVPVAVVGVIALIATTAASSSAGTPKLKPMTAQQLLVAIQKSQATAFSGTVTETTSLGLPSLPGDTSSASLSWQNFLTGSHSIRMWADGPEKQRLALIGQLSEADVVHNGTDLWTYTSDTNAVSHHVLAAARQGEHRTTGTAADLTPDAVASKALAAITPSTKVTVGTARTVAGRSTYTLSLAPRDNRSTVRRISIAIDATKFVPLRVQVFGSSSTPAISVGFTHISFATPAASTFVFHPPAGATTESNPVTTPRHEHSAHARGGSGSLGTQPTVVGSGWTAVLELHDAQGLGGGMLRDVTTSAAHGARLLHTALINVLLLPDGRAFAGAVTPAALETVAAATPR